MVASADLTRQNIPLQHLARSPTRGREHRLMVSVSDGGAARPRRRFPLVRSLLIRFYASSALGGCAAVVGPNPRMLSPFLLCPTKVVVLTITVATAALVVVEDLWPGGARASALCRPRLRGLHERAEGGCVF